jgi:CRP/FNR family transcriptional regulator
MGELLNGNCLICQKKADIFNSLSQEELERIDCKKVRIKYNPGEIIFKQGTPCYNLVCITSGLVKLFIEYNTSHHLIIGLAKPIEYIFIPGAFVDKRHHFTAMACEETTACIIELEVMQKMIRNNPNFALEFIGKVSRQSINLFEKFSSHTHKHVYGRVAESILYLSEKIYESNPFELSLSRQDLADMTGMTKESFIRVLKKFKDDNIISVDGNHLEIINRELLYKVSMNG